MNPNERREGPFPSIDIDESRIPYLLSLWDSIDSTAYLGRVAAIRNRGKNDFLDYALRKGIGLAMTEYNVDDIEENLDAQVLAGMYVVNAYFFNEIMNEAPGLNHEPSSEEIESWIKIANSSTQENEALLYGIDLFAPNLANLGRQIVSAEENEHFQGVITSAFMDTFYLKSQVISRLKQS